MQLSSQSKERIPILKPTTKSSCQTKILITEIRLSFSVSKVPAHRHTVRHPGSSAASPSSNLFLHPSHYANSHITKSIYQSPTSYQAGVICRPIPPRQHLGHNGCHYYFVRIIPISIYSFMKKKIKNLNRTKKRMHRVTSFVIDHVFEKGQQFYQSNKAVGKRREHTL